jgi:hypothetical protein
MWSRIERSSAFKALSPGLRETLRVLLGIADAPMIGRTGMVHGFATRERIAERRGCSRSQVGRDLARLEDLGWIAKAIREPIKFNLGLVFTVFDAPLAAPARLVGVPKGPDLRAPKGPTARAVETLSGMVSPQAEAPMRSPQERARMRSPNEDKQWKPKPSQAAEPRGSAGGVGVAHEGTPRTAEPPPQAAEAVRECLSAFRDRNGRSMNPSTVERLARRPEIVSAGPERIEATWRACQASGLSEPIGGLVKRLERGEIADAPKRSAPMPWDSPRVEELAADAVPIEVAKAEARRIRESLRRSA